MKYSWFYAVVRGQQIDKYKLITKKNHPSCQHCNIQQRNLLMMPSPSKSKDMAKLSGIFQKAHKEMRESVTTTGQGGYKAVINHVYSI